jgi:hypothetical protein
VIQSGDRIDVVLDVFVEDDAYKVVISGVLRPGQPVPSLPVGATRNIVQTWLDVRHSVSAFAIQRTGEEEVHG